jgi:hypothetical protein
VSTYRERGPRNDNRLGRHVNHDSRSRLYAWRVDRAVPLVTTQHVRHVPVLDQGDLGSCTGCAAIGCMGTGRFYATVNDADPFHMLNELDAVAVYSRATQIDPWPGVYPPEDTGSDGLSVAKVLVDAAMIPGYLHAFGLEGALQALMSRPLITGINWYTGMFSPDDDGLVKITGQVEGGHEICLDGYDAERGWVWFTNSWGPLWGKDGKGALRVEDYGRLLDEGGDTTIFVPDGDPTPTPDPPPPSGIEADVRFAQALRPWASDRHVGANARAAKAARAWLVARGL